MFNYRVVIAQAELLRQIFLAKEKDYAGYAELISQYDGPFKALTSWLFARDFDKPQVDDIVGHLDPYIKKGRLKTDEIIVSPSAVKIKNSKPFQELTDFVNFVHGHFPTALPTKKVENQTTERTPVISGRGIQIYETNNPNDGRQLAGDTSWCIAYPGQNNMWTSYRSGGASSFFIVFDENPQSPELRKVAIDFNRRGVELTDINNHTGRLLTNGMDWDKYSKYLEGKGIDIEAKRPNPETGEEEKILQNKPLTDEEKFFLQYYDYISKYFVLSVEDIKKWSRGILEFKSDVTAGEYKQSEFRNGEKELFIEYSFDERLNKILEIQIKIISKFPALRAPIQKDQIISVVDKMGIKYSANISDNQKYLNEENQTPIQPLENYNFGNFDTKEPITEITLRNDDSKNYLTKFVGLGYVLPKVVFEYVLDLPDGKELLIQYVDTGITIPDYQIEKIKEIPSLFKTYVRKQLIALSRNSIQDASILKHLDPDDEKTRNLVLDTLLPKDVINVHSKKISSILDDIEHLPQKWLNLPQLGVLIKPQKDYTDDLAIKVSLCMGVIDYLQKDLTIENILIFLKDPEILNTFKNEAIAQKYLPAIFEPLFTIEEYRKRWTQSPVYINTLGLRDHPKLNKYKALYEKELGLSHGVSDDLPSLYERVAILLLAGRDNSAYKFKDDINFWLYFINNYELLLDSVFKNIDYERTDIKYYDEDNNEVNINDVDTTQIEIREVTNTEYNKDAQRNEFYNNFKKTFSDLILEKPEILQALENNLPKHQVIDIVKNKARRSEILKEYVSENVNSFSELNMAYDGYIFDKDNPIIRKLTENGLDVDDFLSIGDRGFYYIVQLSKWNPELVNNISDDDFFKILKLENSFGDHHIRWLEQNRPKVLVKLFNETRSNLLFSYEQRLYIGKNILPKLQNPEEIEQPEIEDPAPISEAEEMPEEPTTASINIIVKIANKLDNKNKYKLADKFTNILRIYNV